ncbi:unannotated protein [freshwater metagenome]|uniref:phosphoribosylformylglycinamidine cyclo-ligase n=1 Tax=freshwater metagenome TaxID=449393 RepID=A0A6J7P0V6_9ZZZZ
MGEELLEPTRIYAKDCLALIDAVTVHGFSHITGGGLAANIARVLPAHLAAEIDRSTWSPLPIFNLIRQLGAVDQLELERTLNMGIGMVAILPAVEAQNAIDLLAARGVNAWVCGVVRVRGDGEVGDSAGKGGGGGVVMLVGQH